MTPFEKRVVELVRRIPPGKVTTYGLIARAAGLPRGARMVGWILNRRKFSPDLPAHRVVNRHGLLTGKMHFETPTLMAQLLRNEGVPVRDDRIPDLDRYLWIPPQTDE
ncbi:MAG: MGMT family protein [Chlorobi bacterium]|nr:MGMT family protein [Chlorobiota bacterium]